jgi:hypothetical protein
LALRAKTLKADVLQRRIMKPVTMLSVILLLVTAPFCHADTPDQELTGVFRAASGMTTERLQIDGHGLIKTIAISGDALKGIEDGTRLWVSGSIVTGQYGSPDTEREQQHPTQWMIVMRVTKCKEISEPFEDPQTPKEQNKTSEHISEGRERPSENAQR